MAAQDDTVRFLIVGDGGLRRDIEDYVGGLGFADRVIFTGWRRDLPRVYADVDVLVVSSDNEGTPVSAIEAMAAGVPVVATRVGGLPDLVTEGETGLLTPPQDPDALATAVLRLVHNPQRAASMGQKARTAVQDRFTAPRLIADMERLYLRLLAAKGLCDEEAAWAMTRITSVQSTGALQPS